MMDAEHLMSRDPTTGLKVKRDPEQRLTRLEWYTELMTAWVYQREIADRRDHLATFRTAAHALKHAISVLEHSYSKQELYGVSSEAEKFYKAELDGIRIDRSTDVSVPDATGISTEE